MNSHKDRYKPAYSIGEASKRLGVVVPLLRMLEKAEILLTTRNEYGKRLYSECDLDYINALIELGRNENMTIKDIYQTIARIKCWEILNCSEEDRKLCPNYLNMSRPCWTHKKESCDEDFENCRECSVYRSVAELIKSDSDNQGVVK